MNGMTEVMDVVPAKSVRISIYPCYPRAIFGIDSDKIGG